MVTDESSPRNDLVVRSSRDDDVDAMFAIYRQHIVHGLSHNIFVDDELESTDLKRRRRNMRSRSLPHLVAEKAGNVVGYAYVVPFRKRPAYHFTLKHSIYVSRDHVGMGVGAALMPCLVDACAASGYRQIIGYIDATNTASLSLHEKFGFEHVGLLKAVGFKWGKWTDAVLVQRPLGPGNHSAPGVIPA